MSPATLTARATAIAVAAMVLAGCEIPVPDTPPALALERPGTIFEAQWETIYSETLAEFTTAEAAEGKPDPELLGQRVGGEAATIRAAEYLIAAAKAGDPTVFPDEVQAVYTTNAETFPRIAVAVTEAPGEGLTPLVMVWVQDDVQSDYQLRYWNSMLPGAVLPAMPASGPGADMLDLDAEGFVMTPREAIELYATILTEGSKGENNEAFAADAFRDRVFSNRTALTSKAATRTGGTYKDVYEPRYDEAFVLASEEGGALVFVPVDVVSTFKVPGGKLLLSARDSALLEGSLSDQVVYYHSDYYVIRLDADGSDVLPQLVAADHHLVDVTLKEK